MKHKLKLINEAVKSRALSLVKSLPSEPVYEVVIQPAKSKRSLDQNAKLWAMLSDLSRQVEWYGQKLTAENWKDVLTASLKQQKAVPGIDGGFVVLGAHTSKMTVSELNELIELIYAFGAERDVVWSARDDQI